ncbi:MAG: flavin reductase, partial [Nocardioidaceae bacterium]
MTIRSEHPFADPEPARDVVRRFRGRLGGTVSVWTSGSGDGRVGLTVSSLVVAQGEPGHVL